MKKTGFNDASVLIGLSRYGSNFLSDDLSGNDSGSNPYGIIGGQLTRPNYDPVQIAKGIDIRIRELLPLDSTDLEDVVPASLYNLATQSIEEGVSEIQRLRDQLLDSTSKVVELETVTSSLQVELDSEQLKNGILENQLTILNSQFSSTVSDLQSAIQSSLAESISRVSLSARLELLESENKNLRDQLFGISTQVSKGGSVSSDNKFTAKYTGLGNDGDTLIAVATHDGLPNSTRFISANKLQINNVSPELDIVGIEFNIGPDPIWFDVFIWDFEELSNKRIPSQGQLVYDLRFNLSVIRTMEPYRVPPLGLWKGKATTYDSTKLTVIANFSDGSTDRLVLNSSIQKYRN